MGRSDGTVMGGVVRGVGRIRLRVGWWGMMVRYDSVVAKEVHT